MKLLVLAGQNHPINFVLYRVDFRIQLFHVGNKIPEFVRTKTADDLPARYQLNRGRKYQVIFDNNDGNSGYVKFCIEQYINDGWNEIGYHYDIQGITIPEVLEFPSFILSNSC